jgi:hypothetical protein
MKIYFHLFLVLILIILNCVKLEGAGESRCRKGFRDPSNSQLKKQFWQEQRKYEEIISDGHLNNDNYSHLIVEIDIDAIDNKQECSSRHDKLLHDTICPYIIVNGSRTDRYPINVIFAVCNSNCSKACTHKCLPVTILKPILMRTNNCTDRGVAIWEFRLEKRPIQCYCGRERTYMSEPKKQIQHWDITSKISSL